MKPVYRADHVGSLLRPPALVEAHVAFANGELSVEHLRDIEDQAILGVIKMQDEIGLSNITDGEFRRSGWTADYANAMEGFGSGQPPVKLDWHRDAAAPALATAVSKTMPGQAEGPRTRIVTGKIKSLSRLTGDRTDFLKQHSPRPAKVTMPAASYIVSRAFKPGVTDKVYPSRAAVLADVAAVIRAEIKGLIEEGIPYIQIDNPHYPDYFMKEINDQWEAQGVDIQQAMREDVEGDNACFEGLDLQDTTIGMHFCRGNGGALGWHSSGGYDSIAEVVFGGLKVDRLLLEYDSERAGGFEPLRHVRPDAMVVLGLISTKAGALEDQATVMKRIDEAAKFLPLERLALSPQCGFASVMTGNALTMDDQRRKLELVVDTSRKVWG